MPTISQFYGIIIRMYYNDHAPPHFHAEYAEWELIVGISDVSVIAGKAPNRVRAMVLEWAAQHQSELLANWERGRAQTPLIPVDPLV
jgi:hypothetical protein